jgi:cytochrome c-type biogenesis protein
MSAESITLPLAFVAGLLSFASPCVLPLVPAYIGYLSGTSLSSDRTSRFNVSALVNALIFMAGFMVIFVALGASASLVGQLLSEYSLLIARVGGVLLVAFGLRLMGVTWPLPVWLGLAAAAGVFAYWLDLSGNPTRFITALMVALVVMVTADLGRAAKDGPVGRWVQVVLAASVGALNLAVSYTEPAAIRWVESLLMASAVLAVNLTTFFYEEKRFELRPAGQQGYLRSFLFGLVFAAGWTPCVGPILAGIWLLASQTATVGTGVLLLTAYGLGLGIPFLLVALLLGSLSKALRKANRYLNVVSVVSGLFLAAMGILVLTNSLALLAGLGTFFDLGY